MRRMHLLAPMLLVTLLTSIMLSACERPRRSRTAHEQHGSDGEAWVASRAEPGPPQSDSERSDQRPFQRQECTAPRSKVSAYSYALAEAIGQWGLHNQPLLDQFKNTRWDEIPEVAQVRIAKNVRQAFREAAVKQAIANGSPASTIACKREYPNCFNVAGNMNMVGDFYRMVIDDKLAEIVDAAAKVASGRALDPAEQWGRVERLDQRLSELSLLLPESAVLTDLAYPEDPPEAAACHVAKRRRDLHERAIPICTDPQTEAEMRAASAVSPPTPFSVEVRDLGDLDEDGRHEFALDLSSFAAMSTTLLGSDANGCFREVIGAGGGVVHKVLRSRTHGWKDLEFGVPVNRASGAVHACWVTLRATFDGKKYRMVKVIRVEQFSNDGEADLVACQEWAKELLNK